MKKRILLFIVNIILEIEIEKTLKLLNQEIEKRDEFEKEAEIIAKRVKENNFNARKMALYKLDGANYAVGFLRGKLWGIIHSKELISQNLDKKYYK